MLEGLAADTRIIIYLMTGIGVLGVLAKIINQFTLRRLVKAAGNMPKSTHRLIKLVRAKYEHACMIHDSVENIDAFVEKYIYEYRGFIFRIHTWRQIEILSVWFAGILAALGAWLEYTAWGMTEAVYQYIMAGAAEMVLLSVVMRLSDEPYKINAVKMYMTDYLENICAFRMRKQSQREREFIDVIAAESGVKNTSQTSANEQGRKADNPEGTAQTFAQDNKALKGRAGKSVLSLKRRQGRSLDEADSRAPRQNVNMSDAAGDDTQFREQTGPSDDRVYSSGAKAAGSVSEGTLNASADAMGSGNRDGLSINIEGEPRNAQKGDAARQAVRSAAAENVSDEERTALKEEAIRQILEEFLA